MVASASRPSRSPFGLRCRVAGAVARPGSHGTGLALFASGSSGRRVANPAAGRFSTSFYPCFRAMVGWAGALMAGRRVWCSLATETSPRRVKYALRRHHAPTASFRPALTETDRRQTPPPTSRPVQFRTAPLPHRCWVPLSGSQDKTSTSDLNNMPGTPAALAYGSLRESRPPPTLKWPSFRPAPLAYFSTGLDTHQNAAASWQAAEGAQPQLANTRAPSRGSRRIGRWFRAAAGGRWSGPRSVGRTRERGAWRRDRRWRGRLTVRGAGDVGHRGGHPRTWRRPRAGAVGRGRRDAGRRARRGGVESLRGVWWSSADRRAVALGGRWPRSDPTRGGQQFSEVLVAGRGAATQRRPDSDTSMPAGLPAGVRPEATYSSKRCRQAASRARLRHRT